MTMRLNKKQAMSLVEIVVALMVAVAAAIPILQMMTKSNTETTSSINYLRAVELANETIEWASIASFSAVINQEKGLSSLSGPIINDGGSGFTPESVAVNPTIENENWNDPNIFKTELKYSDQYIPAFFYRVVNVEPLDDFGGDMLAKVTVTIKWCENSRPTNLNIDSDERNRQVELSVLVINDENLSF